MPTTTKITDIQRAVLEAAAAREGGYVWPLPEELGLKKGSAVLVMKALLGKGLAKERRARAGELVWREDENGTPMTATVTVAGFKALGGEANVVADELKRMPRAGSKLAALVALLEREEGSTVEEMAGEVGWQAHSVRGVLSGTLVTRFCLEITSEKIDGRGRTYRASSKYHGD